MKRSGAMPPELAARFESEALPYRDQLYPVAVRMTRGREDAEDLVQETMAKAWAAFRNFEPGNRGDGVSDLLTEQQLHQRGARGQRSCDGIFKHCIVQPFHIDLSAKRRSEVSACTPSNTDCLSLG